jgi:hypothetical protein
MTQLPQERGAAVHGWRRVVVAVAVTALVAFLLIPTVRTSVLRAVGHTLVIDEPLSSADVIVVTADANGAGTLEASDLVANGVAARVAVFADPPDSIDVEFLRRGIPYEDRAAQSIRELRSLGVAWVEQIPRTVAGTEDEGRVLPSWCDRSALGSVVVVCVRDHSRRLSRVLRRAMKGHRTTVITRSSRYSPFDPDHWWESRGGTRTTIIELQKLLLDVVLHPFS